MMDKETYNISNQDIQALERLFNAPGSLYCVLGFDGGFRTISGQWPQMLGMSEGEIYRRSLLDLLHPEDQVEAIKAFSKLSSQHRETIHYESRVLCAQGNYTWLSWHIVSDPAASQVYALATDITEQKRLQELFRVTLESAPIGMVMTDASGRIWLCNRQTEKEFGYSRDELIGQDVEMLVPARVRDQHVHDREDYLKQPVTRQMGSDRELYGLRKDGTEFPVEIGLHPVDTTQGTYILSMIIDITERKRSEQVLERHLNLMEVAEHTALVGGWEYDLVTGELYWTRETYHIHGLDPETHTPSVDDAKKYIAPECIEEVNENFERLNRGEAIDSELTLIDAQGRKRFVHVIAYVKYDESGRPRTCYGSIQDITDIKQAHAELLLRDRCLANASDGIIITDPQLNDNPIIYCNSGFTRLTGYEESEVLGHNCRFLQGEDTDTHTAKQLHDAIEAGNSCNIVIKNYRKDGSGFWNRLSITPVVENNEITHFIGVQTDITETMELSHELSYQASHDPLTDLINRREFETRLEQALYRSHVDQTGHVMCYMDLDSFKIVNDTAGHIAGDELLRQMPAIFRQHVRTGDSIARLGGDEFGILLENCSIERAMQIAQDILLTIEDYRFVWEGRAYRVGASIGLVEIVPASGSVMDLLKQADAACYTAKEHGGNRLHCYQAGDLEIERRQVEMEAVTLIMQGLDNNRFFLDYQPVRPLNAPPDPGEHYEVLLRLRSEDDRVIPPNQFLPAAERFHLSPRLDQWVIDAVLRTLSRRAGYADALYLCAINLSGISINNLAFQDYVGDKLDEYGIPGGKICFEITETATIENMTSATRFIERLKARGCWFSLDDFGSGLSSFAYLGTLPVDFVKIDGQFVHDMHENSVHRAMVRSIHEIATIMGKQTIAEFVENERIIAELKTIGVHYMQGFGISRPQALDGKYPA